MPGPLILAVVVIVVLAVALVAWQSAQRRRSERLREQFGSEYERALERAPNRGRAESDLQARAERVEALDIQPVAPEDRDAFGVRWRAIQAIFVDDPPGAVDEADKLIGEVMRARGYPVGDFEQRAADVSVNSTAQVRSRSGSGDRRLRRSSATRCDEGRSSPVHPTDSRRRSRLPRLVRTGRLVSRTRPIGHVRRTGRRSGSPPPPRAGDAAIDTRVRAYSCHTPPLPGVPAAPPSIPRGPTHPAPARGLRGDGAVIGPELSMGRALAMVDRRPPGRYGFPARPWRGRMSFLERANWSQGRQRRSAHEVGRGAAKVRQEVGQKAATRSATKAKARSAINEGQVGSQPRSSGSTRRSSPTSSSRRPRSRRRPTRASGSEVRSTGSARSPSGLPSRRASSSRSANRGSRRLRPVRLADPPRGRGCGGHADRGCPCAGHDRHAGRHRDRRRDPRGGRRRGDRGGRR